MPGWLKVMGIGIGLVIFACIGVSFLAWLYEKGDTARKREASSAPVSSLPKVGDVVTGTNWIYVVTGVESPGKELVTSEFGNTQIANGEWFVIYLTVTNIGTRNFGLLQHDFLLITDGGVSYSPALVFGYHRYKGLTDLWLQFPPGVPIKSALVFDINPTTKVRRLRLEQEKTVVDLSMTAPVAVKRTVPVVVATVVKPPLAMTPVAVVVTTPTPVLPTPTPTPQAVVQVEVGKYNIVQRGFGPKLYGWVENRGNVAVENLQIAVSLLDDAGRVVAASNSTHERDVLPAGEKSPFAVFFLPAPPPWKTERIQVQARPVGGSSFRLWDRADGLALEDVAYTPPRQRGFPAAIISGSVRNRGQRSAGSVKVIALVYGPDQRPIEVEEARAKLDAIPVGGTAPFSIELLSSDGATGYELFVQGDAR